MIHVLKGKRYRKSPMHRLVFGLSFVDVLYSLHLAVAASFIYPVFSPSGVCTADAFLMMLGVASPLYNAALSYYYCLTITFGVSNERFSRRYEPYFHGMVFVVAFATAVLGLFFEIYNPKRSGMGCWVGPYPNGCKGAACDRGGTTSAKIVQYIGSVLPMSFSLLSMIVNNAILYCSMSRLEARNRRYTAAYTGRDTRQRTGLGRRFSLALRSSSSTAMQANGAVRSEPKPISRKMAVQSFCYVGAFLMSYGWGFVHFAILSANDKNVFTLQAINFFLYPLQGFLNAIVYLRPNYLRWRDAGDSRLKAITHALFSLKAPRRRRDEDHRRQEHPARLANSSVTEGGGHVRTESVPKDESEGVAASETASCTGGVDADDDDDDVA